MTKRLTLHRESIADLTPGDLSGVVGAADFASRELAVSCPVVQCATDLTVLPQCGISYNTCSC